MPAVTSGPPAIDASKAPTPPLSELPVAELVLEVERLRLQLAEAAEAREKLTAAVAHRDGVISQLAASRKLVFEEAHRACADNQAELHQMQGALHKVARQLSNERREHAARTRELRRQIKQLSAKRDARCWDPEAPEDDVTLSDLAHGDRTGKTRPASPSAVAVPARRGGSDSPVEGDGVPATPVGFPNKRRPATPDASDEDVDLCMW